MHQDQESPSAQPQGLAESLTNASTGFELTVVIPTHGRSEKLQNLLARIEGQTLDPTRFECIVVDDGSPEPVRVDADQYGFDVRLLRCNQGGPGHARNQALPHSRGALTLYLNDDAVPALDLLERHLAAHAQCPEKTAVLGTFPFTPETLESPFVQILGGTDLLFSYPGLVPNQNLSWGYFWTCNLSLPTDGLRQVGGFDAELFDDAIVEDVELGYRLQKNGYTVRHFPDCKAEHDHLLDPEGYFSRMERLGFYLTRMWAKHDDPHILWSKDQEEVERLIQSPLSGAEMHLQSVPALIQALVGFESQAAGMVLDRATIERFKAVILEVRMGPWMHGIHRALTGVDARNLASIGAPTGQLTTIVMVSYNALQMTQDCIASLRRTTDPERPTEIVVVDNGSTDGSAQWLAAQPDVELISNSTNIGAPAARNQALARGYGEWVCFVDNDIVVTQGWLERAHYHAAADPRVGCVCFVAQRASKNQVVVYHGDGSEEQLEAFSQAHLKDFHRRGMDTKLFASFGILVRNSVIEQIGGFDEAFSPWGFEDDDFAMRSLQAGFRHRVAQDVFVYHAPYPDAEKSDRHNNHLLANWEAFARKWGQPGAPVPKLFDYTALGLRMEAVGQTEDLYCPLPQPQPAVADAPPMNVLERAAQSLQQLDLDAIEQCGAQGEQLAAQVREQLQSMLQALEPLALVPAIEPIPLETNARHRILAWPRYDEDSDLEALFGQYGANLCTLESVCLCLRHDARLDGDLDRAIERLQQVYARTLGDQDLEVLIVNDTITPDQLPSLGKAITAYISLSQEDSERTQFLQGTGAKLVSSLVELSSAF